MRHTTLRDLLLLIGRDVPIREIQRWSEERCHAAEKWAAKTYLRASDNPVRVPPMPAFLSVYRTDRAKGKIINPAARLCPRSYSRVPLGDALRNGIGQYVELCGCGKYVVLRVSSLNLGRIAFERKDKAEGVIPRHIKGMK